MPLLRQMENARTGDDGEGGINGCLLFAPLARLLFSLCLPLSGISIGRTFVFLPAQSANSCRAPFSFLHPRCPNTDVRRPSVRPSVRQTHGRIDADDGRGAHRVNDGGDDEARSPSCPPSRPPAPPPRPPPSVKCAPVILSKSRMPKRGFLRRRRDRHSGPGSPRSDDDHLPEAEDGARYRYRDRGKPFRRVNESCRGQSQCDRCTSFIIVHHVFGENKQDNWCAE